MSNPKEKIYKLISEIYTEFSGQEIAEAIAQVRKEIEAKKLEQELKTKIEDLQTQLEKQQTQDKSYPSLYP